MGVTSTAAPPAHVDPARIVDFDLFNDRRYAAAGLHAGVRTLAEERPRGIYWTPHNGGHWYVTDYELAFAAARDPELFSNTRMSLPPLPLELEPRLIPLTLDPPEHGHYRLPLVRAFSPKVVAEMEPAIHAFAVELIEDIAAQGECDFVHAFAEPFPIITFMRLMGMDTESLPQCRSWARDMLADDDERRAGAFGAVGAMMGELLAKRRAKPENDLISRLIASEIGGKPVTPEDAVGYCLLLFIAGLDTVANSLAFGMNHLAGDRALQARLRAEPERIADAVEELLRLYGVAIVVRLVTRDVFFGGVEMKGGDRVMLLWPAVNYDPAVFTDPTRYDFERAEKRHLTFSAGPHRCAGSHLARLELRLFYEEWFRRMPDVRLDPRREAIARAGLTFGLDTLPIVWCPQ